MTTLSIEDLKAWLALLPKVTPGPYTYGSKYLCRYREGMYYERIAQALENEEDSPRWNTDAAHLAKCDPATIAALIEGYIAMAEALPALRNKIASEADQYNPPPILADDRSDYMAGVQAATHQAQCDFVFELDRILSALNIGDTND